MDPNRREFLSATAVAATLTATAASPVLAQTTTTAQAADTTFTTAPAQGAVAYAAPTEIKKIEIVNLRELEAAAQKVIPKGGFGYIASAAGDEWTKNENQAAFKRVTIVPHYLSGHADADLTTTLLGSKIAMPIITTVMGGHGLAHVTAEAGTAKGTDAAGTIFTAGSQSTLTLEEIAVASPGPKWFQIYLQKDPGVNRDLLLRAKAAGYRAVVVTIDAFVSSNRETDARDRFHLPLPSGNFPGKRGGYGSTPFKEDLGWDDIAFVQKVTGLPVIVKGVMSPELAAAAVTHGCAGIQVSNHGGRQLDDVPAAFTMLPHIAQAVAGRIAIVVDSGFRRGQDVFKALALGANAVAIGRPVMFGLALGGWMGVQQVHEHLKEELRMTMRLAGAATVADISKRYLL
ncbi:MAG TPA: alpha-hydroxy-acid oxidizing protein [Candidatus Binatia bacterium]|nr:alpha-hydroxy-acid oxidizing protein [Candidatus Binatia bacterium]